MNTQVDLQFLLKNGWKLVDAGIVESPDGSIKTDRIESAARALRTKLYIREKIDRKESDKELRKGLTKQSFWRKLFI